MSENSLQESLTAGGKVSLYKLRKYYPDWVWSAERNGMAWNYYGVKGTRTVLVYPVALFLGRYEDDFVTDWRVEEGGSAQSYWAWNGTNV